MSLFAASPACITNSYNQLALQKPSVTGVVRHPVGYLELKWADKK